MKHILITILISVVLLIGCGSDESNIFNLEKCTVECRELPVVLYTSLDYPYGCNENDRSTIFNRSENQDLLNYYTATSVNDVCRWENVYDPGGSGRCGWFDVAFWKNAIGRDPYTRETFQILCR